jgi:transmembrane sensor
MEANVREQAAMWLTELAEGGAGTQERFVAWLRESPRHIEEFLFFSAIWKELDGMRRPEGLDVDELVARARCEQTAAANVLELFPAIPPQEPVREAPPRSGHRMAWFAAAAASAAVVLAAVFALRPAAGDYSTAVGEQRAVKLADGSFIHLNTSSRVRVRYADGARHVELLGGEALFTVARDPARPFFVQAGSARIEVLGTKFNVRAGSRGVAVAVLEGAVSVAGARLGAGESIQIERDGRPSAAAPSDAGKVMAWRQRRLIFDSEPLADIAAEFNRYNEVQIEVRGEAARARRLIGTFDADDPQSLADFLARQRNFVVEREGGRIVVTAR